MIPVIDRIKRDYPELSIRILISQPTGANQKAAMLHLLAGESRYPVIVTNDSDMRATPDYLSTIVQPLKDENIGLVTCCYRGKDARTLTARLEALHMGATFIPLVMVARKLLDMRFAMGATLALRRTDLERIGGFASLVDYLADDSNLALRISDLRKKIHLSKYVIESVLGATIFHEQWQREVRWACTNRLNRPAEYPFQLIYFSTPLSLIYLVVSQFSTTGYAMLFISMLLRWGVGWLAAVWTENHEMRRWLYLLPLRDCLSMLVWVVGGLSSTVIWRGTRLRLFALTETHAFYHGEKVAFGVLTGLQLADVSVDEVETVYSFCEDVGLPITLADIGLGNADRSQLMEVAEKACAPDQPIHHEAGVIAPEKVLDAMLAADALGQGRRWEHSREH